VLTWGRGTKGQLGHGELVNCLKPELVKSFENFVISYVSAGWNHSGFVTGNASLFDKIFDISCCFSLRLPL